MSPLARSLLALAAAAIMHAACATPSLKKVGDNQYQCKILSQGNLNGNGITLPTAYINEGIQDASVDVQNPGCAVVGEQVTVCDDVLPTIVFPSLPQFTPVYVFRNGNYNAQKATFVVTLYC